MDDPRTRTGFLTRLLQLNPVPWRWLLGAEAGVAMALAIGVWTAAGQQSLGLIASLGVFAILYAATLSRTERALAYPFFGAGIVIASAIGVVCSTSLALSVGGLLLVALTSTGLTLLLNVGPPGPLMFMLVAGVSGYIAEHLRAGGGALSPQAIPALVASGVLLSYLVLVVPLMLPSVRKRAGRPRPLRVMFPANGLSHEAMVLGARVLAAAVIASMLGAQLGIQRVYWVVVPAVAILQKSFSSDITVERALHRVLGTILGLGVFALVHLTGPTGIWLVLLIAGFQCAVEIVVARNYALALLFITPLALSISTAGRVTDLNVLMGARLVDTLLGAGVAIAVLWAGDRLIGRSR